MSATSGTGSTDAARHFVEHLLRPIGVDFLKACHIGWRTLEAHRQSTPPKLTRIATSRTSTFRGNARTSLLPLMSDPTLRRIVKLGIALALLCGADACREPRLTPDERMRALASRDLTCDANDLHVDCGLVHVGATDAKCRVTCTGSISEPDGDGGHIQAQCLRGASYVHTFANDDVTRAGAISDMCDGSGPLWPSSLDGLMEGGTPLNDAGRH